MTKTIRTINCKYCGGVHRVERNTYSCSKVFGGVVLITKKKKPAPKIVYHRRSLNKRLDGKWEWSVPLWFDKRMFADCMVKSTTLRAFDSQEEATKDMDRVLKSLGVKKNKTTMI